MWICLCFIHTMSLPWLNPLFLYVHRFIPVFIYCQWSCRHCGLLSMYKVNSCFMRNKVYYINSFREFGNDVGVAVSLQSACYTDGKNNRILLNKVIMKCCFYAVGQFLLMWLIYLIAYVDSTVQTSLRIGLLKVGFSVLFIFNWSSEEHFKAEPTTRLESFCQKHCDKTGKAHV